MQLNGSFVENKEPRTLEMDNTYCSANLNCLKLQVLPFKLE